MNPVIHYLPVHITRSVDDSTAVQFEPDKFLETVEAMLGKYVNNSGS